MDKGEFFASEDRFIHYDFEDVMFSWDHRTRKVRMKFIGDAHETEVPRDQRLFNEAVAGGREISRASYTAGRP